jgi:class 3 adenylate cyclase
MPVAATATVTVLFSDLAGSTALMTRLGDDTFDAVLRRHFSTLRQAAAAFGGVEVKGTGDGLMVVFETSVADGVGCAVAMQRGIAQLAATGPLLRLGLRVGVSIGEASFEQGDWYGSPVTGAARLCGHARPGQILVSDVVRALVGTRGGHRFESVGALDLKGFPDPVPAAEVAWQPTPGNAVLPLPSPLATAATGPFVGRRAELDHLREEWGQALLGDQRCVVVCGETGVGRTRLVAELASRVHDDGAAVLYARCARGDAPHQPVADALRWYVLSCPSGPLRVQVGPLGAELGRLVPALRNRLPGLEASTSTRGNADRSDPGDAVARFLNKVAASRPLLMVVDDLEAAEPATLALFRHLVDWPERAPVMLVATWRTDGDATVNALPHFLADTPLDVLRLRGLEPAGVADLVACRLGPASTPTRERLVAELHAATEGNPRLAFEALESVGEAGTDPDPARLIRCPYKGLLAYQADDAAVFFGREELVDTLLARLATAPLLALVGASGVGKSSVLRAGLMAGVARGALSGSSTWRTVVLTPGARPLASLAGALAAVDGGDEDTLAAMLADGSEGLAGAAGSLLGDSSPETRLVVAVDQLEELFTVCRDGSERARFVETLVHGATTPGGRVMGLLALRADFFGHCAAYPALAAVLDVATALVPPMREDELRSAVEGPGRVAGLRLEPGLTETLLRDAGGEPGALPLVSHALLETWRRREGRQLTLAGYRDSGGVHGAIARTAETVYRDGLDDAGRDIARRIFLRLTEPGEGTADTRRRVMLDELSTGDGEATGEVLRTLADARLVTIGGHTAEFAHEALIREWPRLHGWLDEDRVGLRVHRHLTEAARAWSDADRDPDELYRGARLAAATEWAEAHDPELNPTEHEFLDASRDVRDREQRREVERIERQARANRRLRIQLGASSGPSRSPSSSR